MALECVVVTPEATALQEKADFVALPLFDGEIGIGTNHSPLIGRLGFGEMRIKTGGAVRSYYLDGGFVQVADNVVSVLTNRAIPTDQIDVAAAREQLASAAKRPANSPELLDIRERMMLQARAQIRVGEKS